MLPHQHVNYSNSQLQRCIGSAVVAMGPQRILSLLPISLHSDGFSCTNFWLVPILKDYIIGSSLAYYMDNIVPLARSFQHACCKGTSHSFVILFFQFPIFCLVETANSVLCNGTKGWDSLFWIDNWLIHWLYICMFHDSSIESNKMRHTSKGMQTMIIFHTSFCNYCDRIAWIIHI